MAEKCIGFGVIPNQTQHCYLVEKTDTVVNIYERYKWHDELLTAGDVIRLQVPVGKWKMVEKEMAAEFNRQLRAVSAKTGRFTKGITPVQLIFGKEMMVLLWAVEGMSTRESIQQAIANWKGFVPCERWWLYNMTNANAGGIDDNHKGWRVALKYALCNNPIEGDE